MEQKWYDQFWEEVIDLLLQKYLLELEERFRDNFLEYRKNLQAELINVFENCQMMQQSHKLGKVGYLIPTLLRTNLLHNEFSYPVYAYDQYLYLKDGVVTGNVSADFCYEVYQEFCNAVLQEESKGKGKIRTPHIERMLRTTIPHFHEYMVQLLRGSIYEMMEHSSFQGIQKEEELVIASGELWEQIERICIFHEGEKDIFQLRSDIEDKKNMEFADLRGLSIPDIEFSGMSLGYADFSGSELPEADFSNSLLQGTKFRDCQLSKCLMIHTKLCEADFTNANLEKAKLIGAYASVGLEQKGVWNGAGKLPICLKGTNLRGADFSNAYFDGVDFRQADIEEAIFKGTLLNNCLVTKEQARQLASSEAIMNNLLIGE